MSFRRILQKRASSCGIACVASVAGRTHDQIMKVAVEAKILSERGPFYLLTHELTKLLSIVDVSFERARMARKWSAITVPAIVAVNHHRDSNRWHWVIYVSSPNGGYVLDPRPSIKTSRRTDFNRMRVHSYIPLEPPNIPLPRDALPATPASRP